MVSLITLGGKEGLSQWQLQQPATQCDHSIVVSAGGRGGLFMYTYMHADYILKSDILYWKLQIQTVFFFFFFRSETQMFKRRPPGSIKNFVTVKYLYIIVFVKHEVQICRGGIEK